MLSPDLLKTISSWGGGWPLVVLLFGVVVFLFHRLNKCQADHLKTTQDAMTVINANTAIVKEIGQEQISRTAMLQGIIVTQTIHSQELLLIKNNMNHYFDVLNEKMKKG